jgi:hypothetical protein
MKKRQPSEPLTVFSVFFLLFCALSPLIDYLFSLSVTLVIIPILGLSFIVGAYEIWSYGYMRNPKFQNIFVLIGLLSMATLVFYISNQKNEVTTTTVSREVNAKVVTEYGSSSNFRVVLIAGDDVIPVEDVKNWRDFHVGDAVTGIEKVTETTKVTNVFGKGGSWNKEYVLLKGKE